MRHFAAAFPAIALCAQTRQGPVNLDFKDAAAGQLPAGWTACVAAQGYPALATNPVDAPRSRIEPESRAHAQLWVRVDRPNQKMGFFDNMRNRPITSREWTTQEINGEVSDAIAIGMMLFGKGGAYIDSVSSDTVAPPQITERSRPYSAAVK